MYWTAAGYFCKISLRLNQRPQGPKTEEEYKMTIYDYNTRLDENRLPILKEGAKYNIDNRRQYNTPSALAAVCVDAIWMDKAAEEYCYCLALDTKTKIIGLFEVAHGTINASLVSPREVMQKLLYLGAAAFAIAHNHPSGDCAPSDADCALTKRILEASKIMNIPLVDHIIIGNGSFYSFRTEMPILWE